MTEPKDPLVELVPLLYKHGVDAACADPHPDDGMGANFVLLRGLPRFFAGTLVDLSAMRTDIRDCAYSQIVAVGPGVPDNFKPGQIVVQLSAALNSLAGDERQSMFGVVRWETIARTFDPEHLLEKLRDEDNKDKKQASLADEERRKAAKLTV